MTNDEKGYIQFTCEWEPVEAVVYDRLPELIKWRRLLFEERLVGVDAQGVGYGNMSERVGATASFVITSTQTGHLDELDASHYAIVTDFDVHGNRVSCRGAIKASSESLSHAILYQAAPEIGAVIHVHDSESWERLRGRVPTTHPAAEAGTVAMADEIERLMKSTDLASRGILVMGGHKDGLISFGRNIADAAAVMLRACGRKVPILDGAGSTSD
ncbi:MAG: class II aldolase/adducin family protein [Rhodothermales bacterium]